MTKKEKPWGGRFTEPTNRLVEDFSASIAYDRRLYRYDIEGSIAHCRMLAKQGVLNREEEAEITEGLTAILRDIEKGRFEFLVEHEDIHMSVERALIERIGSVGGKLHTGRSRNDQVALDVRLYLRDEVGKILELVGGLKNAFHRHAAEEMDTILPGYTHMQKAQPVLLSHYLLAFWEMFDRDGERLSDCRRRINVMPLGSAALAGTGIPIDREYVAELLEFPSITKNSMDAVSDRDFVAEFVFCCGLLMMHMSRFCEDLILWSGDEFGYAEISDAFTTGSSIMPQKKNPDVAELIRGKTGRVYGNLVTLLTILKGLPMTYNRDLQEDKEPLFDTVDTVKASLAVLAEMVGSLKFNRQRMLEEAGKGFSTATDVAEYLVVKGLPFRDAHRVVGNIVGYCIKEGRDIASLSLDEFKGFDERFDAEIHDWVTVGRSVDARNVPGGTSREMVMKRRAEIEAKDER